MNNFLNKLSFLIENKYKIHAIGTAISMPGGFVQELGLDFQIYGPLSRKEIRKILIDLANEFLLFINSEEIKSYLENYPFNIKNVDITLFLIDSNGIGLDDPYIGIAEISEGKRNL